jgi:hypothetical protein
VVGGGAGEVASADPGAVAVADEVCAGLAVVEGPHEGNLFVAAVVGTLAGKDGLGGASLASGDASRRMQDDGPDPGIRSWASVGGLEFESRNALVILDDKPWYF